MIGLLYLIDFITKLRLRIFFIYIYTRIVDLEAWLRVEKVLGTHDAYHMTNLYFDLFLNFHDRYIKENYWHMLSRLIVFRF